MMNGTIKVNALLYCLARPVRAVLALELLSVGRTYPVSSHVPGIVRLTRVAKHSRYRREYYHKVQRVDEHEALDFLAGFDDHPLAELWSPPLTTVRQDFADLGGRGMLLLLQRLEEPEARFSSSLPPLVLRGSTAPPPAPDGGRAAASARSGSATSQV